MKKTNRLSLMRFTYAAIIALSFIIGSSVLCYITSTLIDQYICILAINICFFLVFVVSLTRKRLDDLLPEKKYISYGKICGTIILFWVIAIFSSKFSADFYAPVMLYILLGSCVFDDATNVIISIYFVVIIALCQNLNIYIFLTYILIIAFGLALAPFIKGDNQLEKLYGIIIAFAINVLLPVVFYYFNYLEINSITFVYGIIEGVIVSIVSLALMPMLKKVVIQAQEDVYETILDVDYGLRVDIRKFSYIEYQHATRVSRLSRICAQEIGANDSLAAAAGFYYRLGKLEGEPMIDNAIKLANNHCFPTELIDILGEYGGIITLPSTPESAIVHMIDSVVTKVELFDADSMTSSWNQNMVIYQTINELSQNGFYDKSCLSMNQFLKIRERLAQEDILA